MKLEFYEKTMEDRKTFLEICKRQREFFVIGFTQKKVL